MALDKSPSTTHPSCSVPSNRPVSSVEKLPMHTKIKCATTERPNCQSLKQSRIPSPLIKAERSASVSNMDVNSTSSNTNARRTPSAAHTRPWRPSSVMPQHIQSETHLPNPRLAKLLDRGWKSAPILPSYPLAGPKCNTPKTPNTRRLPAPAVHNTAKHTTKHSSSNIIRREIVDDDSNDESESPREHRKICCIPIPVFHNRSDVMTSTRRNTNTARQQVSSTKRVSVLAEISTRKSSAWPQAEQSRIPVARSISPLRGNLNTCKPDYVHSRPVSAISAPIRGTSKIPVLCHTSGKPFSQKAAGITSSCTSLNSKKAREQDVPSQNILTEKGVVNISLKTDLEIPRAQGFPSLEALAEKVVGDNSLQKTIKVPKVQEVPSLNFLAEKVIGNKSQQQNITAPRTQGVPSLKFLTERAVGNNSRRKNIEEPRTQDVPSLKFLAERAVGNNSLQKKIVVPRTRDVPSLKFLAERAAGNNSLQKHIGVPRARDVPSLKVLAERAAGNNSLQKHIGVPRTRDVPSLKFLAERAVGNNSLQKNIVVPRVQGFPSLKSSAEKVVGDNSLQDIEVARTQDVPSLKYLAEGAVCHNSLQENIEVARTQEVSSLKSLTEKAVRTRTQNVTSLKVSTERAVGNNSLQKNIKVPKVQKVPSQNFLAVNVVGNNNLQKNIGVPRTRDVPSLKFLAERAVGYNSLQKHIGVPRKRGVPSLKSYAEEGDDNNSPQKNIVVPIVQEFPSLKSLAEKVVDDNSLQNIEVARTQDVPSLNYLAEGAVCKNSLQKIFDIPKIQEVPSLKSLAEKTVGTKILQKNIEVPRTQNVPSLKVSTERAVANKSLQKNIKVPKVQEVPSQNFLAENVVGNNSLQKNIKVLRTQNVPNLKFLAERAVDNNNLPEIIDVPRTQEVPSLKFLAEKAVRNNTLQKNIEVPRAQNDSSLKFLAERAVGKNSLQQNIEVPRTKNVSSLNFLTERAVSNNSIQENIMVPRIHQAPSLKFLAEKAIERNSPTQNIEVTVAQVVPSLKLLARKAVDNNSLQKSIAVPKAEEIPNLKLLAEKAAGNNRQLQNSIVSRAQDVPSLRCMAETAFDKNSRKQVIEVPKALEVPCLSCLAKEVVETNGLNQNNEESGIRTAESSKIIEVRNVTAGFTDIESFDVPESHLKILTQHSLSEYSFEQNNVPKTHEGYMERSVLCNKRSDVPTERHVKTSDSKRKISCCSTRRSRPPTRASGMPKVEGDGKEPESADKSDAKSDWNYYSTERAQKKHVKAPDVVNGNKKQFDVAVALEKDSLSPDACSNSPVSDEQKSGIKPANGDNKEHEDKNLTYRGKYTKTTGSCENEQNVKKKTPRLNKKKKIERVADKVDQQKLQRLRHGRDDISNSDVFSMITAIHEEDKEAAKMLDELKLITKLEKEQRNKITKSKAEEAQLVAEIGDVRDKLADTIEKKEKVDEKLLKIYKEELKPDTEYDVIENYLHTEKMAKTYHEKKHFEECNIAYLEHELQTKLEQQNLKHVKNTIEPKIKPRMTRNAIRLQKEKGHKVRQDKINKTVTNFENGSRHKKDKCNGAKYFKALDDTNYKHLPPGMSMKEMPKSHKKTGQGKSGKGQKPTCTNIPIKNTATSSNKTLSMNNNKTNISSTTRHQTRRHVPSTRNKDVEKEQKDLQKENRILCNKKEVSEKKSNNPLLMRNNNTNVGTNKQKTKTTKVNGHTKDNKTKLKYVSIKNVEIVPKIDNQRSRIDPKPNGIKPASSENTTESVHIIKVGMKSNVQDVSAMVHGNINKSDNLKRNLNTVLLKRPTAVQTKTKPTFRNTQLPPLKHCKQTEAKLPKITAGPDDKRRVKLPQISNQKTKNHKDRHAKEVSTVSKPDFVF